MLPRRSKCDWWAFRDKISSRLGLWRFCGERLSLFNELITAGSLLLRRAIVHIGTPRSGTTTLQRILFARRSHLAGRLVLYPDLTPSAAASPHLSHQHLGEALDGRAGREALHLLESQLASTGCDVVLLSYEGLCLAPSRHRIAERLATLLARYGFAMEVLMTVKPQTEYLNSMYTWRAQFLRESRPFAAYARSAMVDRRFDYARIVKAWRPFCGDRLHAVPVRDAMSDRPLVERLFADCGLADRTGALLTSADLALVENRSPGPVTVEVARQLRRTHAHLWLGEACRDATRFIEQAAWQRGLDGTAFNGLDDDIRRSAATVWARSNEEFAALVWQCGFSARVAEAPPANSNEIAGQPGQAPAAVDDIRRQTCSVFGLTAPWRGRLGLRLAQAAARHWAQTPSASTVEPVSAKPCTRAARTSA